MSASVGPNVAWARKRAASESLNGPAVRPSMPSWNSGSGPWLKVCAATAPTNPQEDNTSSVRRTARRNRKQLSMKNSPWRRAGGYPLPPRQLLMARTKRMCAASQLRKIADASATCRKGWDCASRRARAAPLRRRRARFRRMHGAGARGSSQNVASLPGIMPQTRKLRRKRGAHEVRSDQCRREIRVGDDRVRACDGTARGVAGTHDEDARDAQRDAQQIRGTEASARAIQAAADAPRRGLTPPRWRTRTPASLRRVKPSSHFPLILAADLRSEERRVGKE